ncbi:bifunctional 3-(3-hydroxy-phenyl)propionate/3-hydroxycinnamic acid hydroxylase [Amycolatopsis endophytica]|uniref:3-(3-hydroxy-phenyl)propionate hydroxylase n=1 Tax=Amycolatopsis endophytica TaxID=860233 RepID=A0A853BD34_9PSEU|nr:bifunctional 3-(3-hydroxy-phenyl)propionate/3-hydroxycinnamic acid hydroxylase [Amycolatopsis endophytica]NYI92336.1 3-(3-hydroxy-phenyl)propionate hydroxylase [Amycolatopsis endophytica]
MSEQVVVVGAGPVGLTSAILLAQRGVRTVILERHHDVYPLPRAAHLDDEIMRILQQVGIVEEFARRSRPGSGLRLVDGSLETIIEFRRDRALGNHGWPEANFLEQPALERLLREAAAGYPEIELRSGQAVERLEFPRDGDRGVRALVRDVTTGEAGHVDAHVLLGCDGANSLTREAIGATMRDLRFEERWLVIDVDCPTQLDVWDGVYQICDPHRAGTFMQVADTRYRWEFQLREGETLEHIDFESLLWPWTKGAAFELIRKAEYTFRATVADRWRKGRVFLLGDAAHLTPPFIGQGMGSGFRDAMNLAWKLALVLNEGADERLLDTYETERKPHVEAMIRNAVAVGWAMTGGNDLTAALRRRAITTAGKLPGFADLVLKTSSPRVGRSPLVLRTPGDRLAGTSCPQPWLTTPSGRRRLDDVLGGSFGVVHTGELDADAALAAKRLDAVVIDARASTELVNWLGDATAAVIRPDRVVLTTYPRRRATGWLTLLPSHRTHPAKEHCDDPVTSEQSTVAQLRGAGRSHRG